MFHPRGLLFEAEITSHDFPPHGLVRLSSAWWKYKEWPDVLGVAIRFSPAPITGIEPHETDQDLLFASFPHWWQILLGPMMTNHHDFLQNHYYGVADFISEGKVRRYKLIPKNNTFIHGSRQEKIIEAVLEGEAIFLFQEKTKDEWIWNTLAEIKLVRTLHYDQEALRFNPFQNGLKIRPYGFLQHLRVGAYRMSQSARPESES